MKNKYIKRVICLVVLLSIVMLGLWYSNQVLIMKRTDGITTMKDLYAQEENSIDVLMLGSSHCGMNLDAETFWKEYGIASYALWGSVQPFWNSYHFLKEALKTQKPKVVLLETYAATLDFEYSDDARQVTNVSGMKWSRNKLEAIKVSAPKERWKDLILGMPLYHSRYSELTKDDFMHFPWSPSQINSKGTGVRYGTADFELKDVSTISEVRPIHEKQEKYLRKIIEVCETENIPLVLITTPTVKRVEEQPYHNYVALIAEECNIPYYNFNLMDSETGFEAEDFWNDGSHINTKGARKVSSYLGKILKEKYELPDHRGDENYSSWDANAVQIQNSYFRKIVDTKEYFEELQRNDRAVMVVKNSTWEDTEEYSYLLENFIKLGVDTEILKKSEGGNWILESTQNGKFENQYFGDMYSEYTFDGQSFSMDYANGTGFMFNGETLYFLNGPGVILVVYDINTKKCIDIVSFLKNNNFKLQHEPLK